MLHRDLPPLDLNLTPYERSQAALWQVELESQRRDRNAEDKRREAVALQRQVTAGQGGSP